LLGLALRLEPRSEVHVSPQLVAQSALLELSGDELEALLEQEARNNPALILVRRCEPEVPPPATPPSSSEKDEDAHDLAAWVPAPTTVRDDLLLQFLAAAPKRLRRVGELLISALDDNGYFRGDLAEVAEVAGTSLAAAEEALSILQRLDPPGIGSRSLRECLLLQLDALPISPPPGTRAFLEQCLDRGPLEMMRAARRLLGLTEDQLQAILAFVRTHFHPYPARLLAPEAQPREPGPPPAQPDVAVEAVDGHFVVTVPFSERLQVRIDALYATIADQLRHRRHLAEYERQVKQRVGAARALVSLLQRREQTLAKVTEAILASQADYLSTGEPRRLRPLDQKDIARALGLHESTVCRALKNKHVLMPDGNLLPFEFFFDETLPAKVELQRLICEEPPDKPYSDQQLAALLAERGYPLARRTVTKYRLQLGIGPAHKRRARRKNLAAAPRRRPGPRESTPLRSPDKPAAHPWSKMSPIRNSCH
jgi:RNA polymerase sigma-54 factor